MAFGWTRPLIALRLSWDSIALRLLGVWNDRAQRFFGRILKRRARTTGTDQLPPTEQSEVPVSLGLSPGRCGCGAGADRPGRTTDFTRLLTTAIEAAANGVCITDREGVVQWVNPAFTAITGYTQHEMVGQTPRLLKAGVQPTSFYKQMWNTILAGRVWHGELSNRHKLGHIYVEEQTIAPVSNDAGEITHFIGIKQDVTRRREYEQALKTRNAELALMTTIIATVTSSLEVGSVLASIVDSTRELLPHAAGATIQLPDAAGLLVTRAASGRLGPQGTPMSFEPGRGFAGLAYRDRTDH